MKNTLQRVDYSQFRHSLNKRCSHKVKNKGYKTYLYDSNNKILAILKTASIDAFGRIRPAEYFVAA